MQSGLAGLDSSFDCCPSSRESDIGIFQARIKFRYNLSLLYDSAAFDVNLLEHSFDWAAQIDHFLRFEQTIEILSIFRTANRIAYRDKRDHYYDCVENFRSHSLSPIIQKVQKRPGRPLVVHPF